MSGAFPFTSPIPANESGLIVLDFIHRFIIPSNCVDVSTVIGIGSTRAALKKELLLRSMCGDLDLLAVASRDRKKTMKILTDFAVTNGYQTKIAFGNILNIAWPFFDKFHQIDLMVAEPSVDNQIYEYMKRFRYWSSEINDRLLPFNIKGAHRSELVKTLVKAVGLSAAETHIIFFKWNGVFDDLSTIINTLTTKSSKFKNVDKKSQMSHLIAVLDKLDGIDELKSILSDSDGFLKSRYSPQMFGECDMVYDILVELLFDKVNPDDNWSDILDMKYGSMNVIDEMDTFDNTLILISDLVQRGTVSIYDITCVFREVKDNFNTGKAVANWNRDLEEYIEDRFPFLTGNW